MGRGEHVRNFSQDPKDQDCKKCFEKKALRSTKCQIDNLENQEAALRWDVLNKNLPGYPLSKQTLDFYHERYI